MALFHRELIPTQTLQSVDSEKEYLQGNESLLCSAVGEKWNETCWIQHFKTLRPQKTEAQAKEPLEDSEAAALGIGRGKIPPERLPKPPL